MIKIHLHIEVKISNRWHHYACPYIGYEPKIIEYIQKNLAKRKLLCTAVTIFDEKPAEVYCMDDDKIKLFSDWLIKGGRCPQGCVMEYTIIRCFLFGNFFSDFPPMLQDVRFIWWFEEV